MADHKKKRAYAAQAYDFGANAQPAGAAPAGIPGVTPSQGMMPSPGLQPGFQPGYPPQGGYQPPGQDQLAGQFGQMNLGPQQPAVQQVTPQPPTTAHLNQLFPSDLIQQVRMAGSYLDIIIITKADP